MYHKVKNTLVGLTVMAAFIAGGALVSEPVPAKSQIVNPALSTETHQATLALAILKTVVSVAQAEAATQIAIEQVSVGHTDDRKTVEQDDKKQSSSRLRLELGMPYYSFGKMLPRRRES